LTLAFLDANIRSDGHPLYGWLIADLGAVDAPLCSRTGPSPSSQDPLNPGVLVSAGRDGHQFLTVANAGHKFDPNGRSYDGCGIMLSIDRTDERGFSGRWGPYGGAVNGCGFYRAVRNDP
jgi:hypothetical protein